MKYKMTTLTLAAVSTAVLTACSAYGGSASVNGEPVHTYDVTNAKEMTVESGRDIRIDSEGTYILTGQAKDACIIVDAPGDDHVGLVFKDLTVTNESIPCVVVKKAGRVTVTVTDDKNSMSVTGDFDRDGDTKADAVIFSRDELVINGTGTLTVSSSDNGIKCKDRLEVSGGTLVMTCEKNAISSKEDILISDAVINIEGCNDGLHADNDDDDTKGSIFIEGGRINIVAADDAIHATMSVRIDGGECTLNGREGIEGTVIRINDGDIKITASDDGINAAHKSKKTSPLFEMNSGRLTIRMEEGDRDGIDSNGDIVINGGTVDITGSVPFDYDGTAVYRGGTIIENGIETNAVTKGM